MTQGFFPDTKPASENNRSAFGELLVVNPTPITQIVGDYGLNTSLIFALTEETGSVSTENSVFKAETGTDPAGLAIILARRQIKYRAGQGLAARFTAFFANSSANSEQIAGLLSSGNALAFGNIDGVFGILHRFGGIPEYQELTITTPAAGAEVATVTIDGVGYPVNLTAGTVNHNAFEIASQLNFVVPNYIINSNNDQVLAQDILSRPAGAFAFSSATAVAAWSQEVVGSSPTDDFIPQTSWNRDPAPGLDQTKGNVYQIQYQYLGFGNIFFSLEDEVTGQFKLVHVIEYANKNIIPSTSTPTFLLGWSAQNTGGTTSVSIEGGSAEGIIEGEVKITAPPMSDSNFQTGVGLTLTNVVSFRNRAHFGGKFNRIEMFPKLLSLSTDTVKSAFFEIVIDPVFGDDVDFQYVDKDNSAVEAAKDPVTISGGISRGTFVVGADQSLLIKFDEDIIIEPGQIICIAARISAGSASEMRASLNWVEDL